MHLFRYYWHHRPTAGQLSLMDHSGHTGEGVCGFQSFRHAQEQIRTWRTPHWQFLIPEQAGITIPRAILDSDDVKVLIQPSTQQAIATPQVYHHSTDIERWRYVFTLHHLEAFLKEEYLAPPPQVDTAPSAADQTPDEPGFEFVVTQTHEARYRIRRSELSDRQWAHLAQLSGDPERANYLKTFFPRIHLLESKCTMVHMDTLRDFEVIHESRPDAQTVVPAPDSGIGPARD